MHRSASQLSLLLSVALAALPATVASGDTCATVRVNLEGTVSQHKKTAPYPFQSECVFLVSKVVVREGDERYFSYVTPATACYFDGSATPGDCASIHAGDQIQATWDRKDNSLTRGNLVAAHIVHGPLVPDEPDEEALEAEAACLNGGTEATINNALTSTGVAVLCQGTTFNLSGPVVFSGDDQQVYTQGKPTGASRATLRAASSAVVTAVESNGKSGVKLLNVIVRGRRPAFGHVAGGPGLVRMGGTGARNIEVAYVLTSEPRGFSSLHIFKGTNANPCAGAWIHNNTITKAGQPDGTWADGISLGCRSVAGATTIVENNTIIDATDGGIVIFGAPGAIVRTNTVRAETRTLLGGINLVDHDQTAGDYTGTLVEGNTIDARSAFIKTGIAMGPRTWFCVAGDPRNSGATVRGNAVTGAHMGFGYPVSGVSNWTVVMNTSTATYTGTPGLGCSGFTTAQPGPFLRDGNHSSGVFQIQYESDAYLDYLLGISE